MRKIFVLLGLMFLFFSFSNGKKYKLPKYVKNKKNLRQDSGGIITTIADETQGTNENTLVTEEEPQITEEEPQITEEEPQITEEEPQIPEEDYFLTEADTTTTASRFVPPMRRTATPTTTTTPEPFVNFTDAKSVEEEIHEALIDFEFSMKDNLEEFLMDARERTDTETSRVYEQFAKDEFFNLFEGKCTNDQLTTFNHFETSLDAFVKIHMENEFEGFEDFVVSSFKRFNKPFQEYVRANLETPLTTALRFNRVERWKSIHCANTFVPEIIDFIENGYVDILDCYFVDLYYNDTDVYQDIITSLYRETSSYLTTCTNAACFKKTCWRINLLVLRATGYATDTMSSILKNLKIEFDNIGKCINHYVNTTFVSYTSGRDSLRSRIVDCLR